ncbi:protein ref(2)P-like isoform X1 [Anastrepha ludens]|uniref:protein ref(2)P-like n=1 Tax=Anastrepha ludens TaxID=28586 RepID=UPI0023AE999B|nr:protein ref(2)P-like [Anastrepha ludens]XP_053958372.1 protein ref(2)P-like [Anastrepha ludens]XP_053959073.1 protein ref(2)P-like isoform X1 [Anastrepha ludens]
MTPLKITFANAIRKLNFYIRNRPQDYECLKQQLDYHLFGRRNLPKCELELYWIDQDSDEIYVLNSDDYIVFQYKCGAEGHLFAVPKAVKNEGKET